MANEARLCHGRGTFAGRSVAGSAQSQESPRQNSSAAAPPSQWRSSEIRQTVWGDLFAKITVSRLFWERGEAKERGRERGREDSSEGGLFLYSEGIKVDSQTVHVRALPPSPAAESSLLHLHKVTLLYFIGPRLNEIWIKFWEVFFIYIYIWGSVLLYLVCFVCFFTDLRSDRFAWSPSEIFSKWINFPDGRLNKSEDFFWGGEHCRIGVQARTANQKASKIIQKPNTSDFIASKGL